MKGRFSRCACIIAFLSAACQFETQPPGLEHVQGLSCADDSQRSSDDQRLEARYRSLREFGVVDYEPPAIDTQAVTRLIDVEPDANRKAVLRRVFDAMRQLTYRELVAHVTELMDRVLREVAPEDEIVFVSGFALDRWSSQEWLWLLVHHWYAGEVAHDLSRVARPDGAVLVQQTGVRWSALSDLVARARGRVHFVFLDDWSLRGGNVVHALERLLPILGEPRHVDKFVVHVVTAFRTPFSTERIVRVMDEHAIGDDEFRVHAIGEPGGLDQVRVLGDLFPEGDPLRDVALDYLGSSRESEAEQANRTVTRLPWGSWGSFENAPVVDDARWIGDLVGNPEDKPWSRLWGSASDDDP